MADSLPTEGHILCDSPELVRFMEAAKACYMAGECFKDLRDIVPCADGMVPDEMRYHDPRDTYENVFGRARPVKPASP